MIDLDSSYIVLPNIFGENILWYGPSSFPEPINISQGKYRTNKIDFILNIGFLCLNSSVHLRFLLYSR